MSNELDVLKNYLEDEYKGAVRILTHPLPYWCDPNEQKEKTIVRGLGATMYAQYLGVSYNEVAPVYDNFKELVENIIPTKERKEIRL